MPNRKSDTNNNGAFSTDNIGMNYDYPDADYAAREKIASEHRDYQLGLMWMLANDPARSGQAAAEVLGVGPVAGRVHRQRPLAAPALRPRGAADDRRVRDDRARMSRRAKRSPIRSAWRPTAWIRTTRSATSDAGGHVRNEGDVQVPVAGPYPISYRAIVPKAAECTNLLVPVCLSATHIAYGSIRMEPVFMVLGQSAATAAVPGSRRR